MSKARRQIFIVDDHPVFREGLVGLVKREPDLDVCGEADHAAKAILEIQKLRPDLVLADIGLPGKCGLELIKDIRVMSPDIAVLAISMHDESLYAERVLKAGGRGYIMKQERPEKIVQAIRQLLNGQIFLSAQMSNRILNSLSDKRPQSSSPIARLSDRELEILQLIGRGKDSHEIAQQLHLSVKTVDTHRGNLKEKLELKNGTELICYAARWVERQQTSG
ncbi:MAG: response regulator transcription factor [Verrucomicrobiota bacterium]